MRCCVRWLASLVIVVMMSLPMMARAETLPLPVDSAFHLSVTSNSPTQLLLTWDIAPGYQLYRKALHVQFDPNIARDLTYPQGEFKYDAVRGRYEAYLNQLIFPVTIEPNQSTRMTIAYQGCSESGFCYPPITRVFQFTAATKSIDEVSQALTVPEKSADLSWYQLLSDQLGVKHLFGTHSLWVTWLIFIGLGLLLSFTPCVLPMIPILTGMIVGRRELISTSRAFILSLSYVLGAAFTYSLAGVFAAWLGSSLQVWLQQPWMIVITSAIFALLSLSLMGLFELRLPQGMHQRMVLFSTKQTGEGTLGIFVMGMISALIVSPCVTAPLVGVLLYIAESGSLWLGASALFMLGLGMGIPLLVIGTSMGRWLPKSGPWMESVKVLFGFIMMAMAIWILSRILAHTMIVTLLILWGAGVSVFLVWRLPKIIGRRLAARVLAIIASFSGAFFFLGESHFPGMASGFLLANHGKSSTENSVTVTSVAGLEAALSKAHAEGRLAMVDFYADWCESCKVMESTVLNQANVQKALQPYSIIRADLSENSTNSEALMKSYQVIAPPTFLFFNEKGQEQSNARVVGEVNPMEFLSRSKQLSVPFCETHQTC